MILHEVLRSAKPLKANIIIFPTINKILFKKKTLLIFRSASQFLVFLLGVGRLNNSSTYQFQFYELLQRVVQGFSYVMKVVLYLHQQTDPYLPLYHNNRSF